MLIYKIVDGDEWDRAQSAGRYEGAAVDLRDGFIHFSTAAQVRETAAKHFAGRENLLLVAADADLLRNALKWEKSRNDEEFPHLYGEFPMSAVVEVQPLPLGPDGLHLFPAAIPK